MRRGVFAVAAFAILGSLGFVHPFGNPRMARPQGRDTLLRAPDIPPDVRNVLVNKCADCHSAETQWPLYSRLPPGSWLIERDIVLARRNMDLSHWAELSSDDQALMRAKISGQAKRGKMPPLQYRALHWGAKLASADVEAITQWARGPNDRSEASSAPGDAARGRLVFEKRCTGCHSMDTSDGKEGPPLAEVIARRAGTAPHFAYSTGLKNSGVIWNDATLNQWLSGPETLVPGNNMDFRVPNPDERRDLIAYLKHWKHNRKSSRSVAAGPAVCTHAMLLGPNFTEMESIFMKKPGRFSSTALCAALMLLLTVSREPRASYGQDPDATSLTATINPVVQWNRNLLVIVRTPGVQPATMHATRSFAIMHAAIYDAVNAIDKSHAPYLIRLRPRPRPREASQDAAADAAAHEVLVTLYPSQKATLDANLQTALAQIPDGQEKQTGIRVGLTVADQILQLRSADGASAPPIPYVFGRAPGDYQSTPPNFPAQPQLTQWRHVTPFVIESASEFRPGPPPALDSNAYTTAFNEVKEIGMNNSTTATADQQQIGLFWNGAIQNYWNEIAQTTSIAHDLTTAENARLFALLNISLADTVIAFYDAKYMYNRWRPVTAIRAADTDNNLATIADPTWLPEAGKNTAPDPSYPGAHAAISAAAAEVLRSFFKTDRFQLVVTSEVLPNVERSFMSFTAASNEAALSRVLAGQHFSFDEDAGERLGRDVATFVYDHLLAERDNDDQQNLIAKSALQTSARQVR